MSAPPRPTSKDALEALENAAAASRYNEATYKWRRYLSAESAKFANGVGKADWFEVVIGDNTDLVTSSAARAYRYFYNNYTEGERVNLVKVTEGERTVVLSQ